MNNIIFEQVDFLLPKHSCVILPGFGAFIANSELSSRTNSYEMKPPAYSIIFNQDINHNDGLIASAIQSTQNISFSAANNLVSDFVREIKNTLHQGKSVKFGKLGILNINSEGNIVFYCNESIVSPSYYGLSPVSLQLIDHIDRSDKAEQKRFSIAKRLGTAAAVAAGLFLFAVPSINIEEATHKAQTASFLDIVNKSIVESAIPQNIVNSEANGQQTISNTDNNIEYALEKPTRTYYIIIGSEETEFNADKLLSKFQNLHFPKAAIVKSDRYRIYVASFYDKMEAERYLDIFRLENPQYATAWLYSKKNIY